MSRAGHMIHSFLNYHCDRSSLTLGKDLGWFENGLYTALGQLSRIKENCLRRNRNTIRNGRFLTETRQIRHKLIVP
jgi:hypothetical protein